LLVLWLQREIQREQQKVRELEVNSERQKRILRVKMDEMSVMQRRLRSAGLPVANTHNVYACCLLSRFQYFSVFYCFDVLTDSRIVFYFIV